MEEEELKLKKAIEKWQKEFPLHKQLPIKYKSGVSFNELECKCLICLKDIPENDVHGLISRPIESVVTVDALGWCKSCNILTPFFFRVRGENGELTMEWLDKEKGWLRSQKEQGLINKILKWIM